MQVRGATAHFDAVVSGATSGVLGAAMASGVPVIFCVMTTDTMEQVTALDLVPVSALPLPLLLTNQARAARLTDMHRDLPGVCLQHD